MRVRKFINKSVLTLVSAAILASGIAFAESVKVSEPKYDESLHTSEYWPNGVKQGQYTDNKISAYKTTKNSEGDSTNTIECNVKGATLYVDGEKAGNLPYKAVLTEGDHTLRIDGGAYYESKEVTIRVNNTKNGWFFIELERITGKLIFKTEPDSATVEINKQKLSSTGKKTVELNAGNHKYTVKAFGYKEINESITVYGGQSRSIQIQMDEAPFALEKFSITGRDTFNPKAGGKFSKVECYAKVTGPGTGVFQIKDSDGKLLYEETKTFTTWDNYFTWNGKDKSGNFVDDGAYTAVLEAGTEKKTLAVTVNSDLSFQRTWITPNGSGLGTVASAAFYPKKTWGGQVNFSGIYNLQETDWDFNINAAGLHSIGNHFEISTGINFNIGDPFAVQWSANLKGGSKIKLDSSALYWALYARYGICTDPLFAPYGADTGAGAGGGLALGWEKNGLYLGASAGATYQGLLGTFKAAEDPLLINYGLMINYTKSVFTAGAYASASTCIGNLNYTNDKGTNYTAETDLSAGFIRALQAGAALKFYPWDTAVNIDLGADLIYYPSSNKIWAGVTFGLSAFY